MDDPEPALLLIGVGLSLLILAFTSAVDAAFTAISRHRLHALLDEQNPCTGQAVTRLLADPYRFRATIVVLNLVMYLVATSLTLALVAPFGPLVILSGLATLLVAALLIGELIPKALASRDPAAAAMRLARPMERLALLIWPFVALISLPMRPLYRLLSGKEAPSTPLVTEEELRMLVNVGEEEGLIEHEERAMIEGVITFGDTVVRELMVPRVDIVSLPQDASLEEALDLVSSSGYSRIPVYGETVDEIVGLLYAKDLIPSLRGVARASGISELLRPAHFVPETIKVNALLEEMQRRKVHLVIVVDEYGGTAGLATIEDLIEQIVGEIQDEYDTDDPSIQLVGEGVYLVEGRVLIHDLNELADLDLHSETAERLGGLVYEVLGRMPRVGDRIRLEEVEITVLAMKGVRAEKLRVARHQPELVAEVPMRAPALEHVRGSH
ncbi:MAG: hemolysin family protein [Oscillochloridaceae bacterium umkhey_bin13]